MLLRRLLAAVCAISFAVAATAAGALPGDMAKAHAALAKGDGIGAEVALRRALASGAPRRAVAAAMGEALLLQHQNTKARDWLADGAFDQAEASRGYRALGRLEQADGNFPAAGRALDRALAAAPNDPGLWVDIGRLRYVGGQQRDAIEAADKAVALGPGNVRALEFRGQLVRDRIGPVAALAWFERGLAQAPEDVALLGEYAATLGDVGAARDSLEVTRKLLAVDPGNARAYFIQALLAARAAKYPLARRLLGLTRGQFDDVPAVMLFAGVLELQTGNRNVAVDVLARLVDRQPDNAIARAALAHAYQVAGQVSLARSTKAPAANSDRTVSILGGGSGAIGVLAADYAADKSAPASVASIRALLAVGRGGEAAAIAERLRALSPGARDSHLLAGDVQLAIGNAAAAKVDYAYAAQIRMDEALLVRAAVVLHRLGQVRERGAMVQAFLAQHPRSILAWRLSRPS